MRKERYLTIRITFYQFLLFSAACLGKKVDLWNLKLLFWKAGTPHASTDIYRGCLN